MLKRIGAIWTSWRTDFGKKSQTVMWSCRAYVPASQLTYAAFRSKAKGVLPPSDEWRRRGL